MPVSNGPRVTLAAFGAYAVIVCVSLAPAAEPPDELRRLPASTGPSPEGAQLEAAKPLAPSVTARASKEELAQRVAIQPGGAQRLESARARKAGSQLPAGSSPVGSDAFESQLRETPAIPRTLRPTKQELETVIQRQPDGAARLQRARQPGNPVLQRTSMLSFLGIGSAHAAANLSITLTPQTNSNGTHAALRSTSPYASATLVGSLISGTAPTNAYGTLYAASFNWGDGTSSSITRPYVQLIVNVPEAGHYIVNVRADAARGVQLRHAESGQKPILQTFQETGLVDRPALLNLGAGYHTFWWVFPNIATVYSVSIDSYP